MASSLRTISSPSVRRTLSVKGTRDEKRCSLSSRLTEIAGTGGAARSVTRRRWLGKSQRKWEVLQVSEYGRSARRSMWPSPRSEDPIQCYRYRTSDRVVWMKPACVVDVTEGASDDAIYHQHEKSPQESRRCLISASRVLTVGTKIAKRTLGPTHPKPMVSALSYHGYFAWRRLRNTLPHLRQEVPAEGRGATLEAAKMAFQEGHE